MDEWVEFYQPGHGLHQHGRVRRRRHRHRLLGADEQGGRQRHPQGQVPAQRAGRRPARSRRSTSTWSSTAARARSTSRSPPTTSWPASTRCARPASSSSTRPDSYYDDPELRARIGKVRVPIEELQGAQDPGRPGRGRLPAADLHQAGAGPADGLLRADRAARLARLRQGQLQGAVRGDRAGAGASREPVTLSRCNHHTDHHRAYGPPPAYPGSRVSGRAGIPGSRPGTAPPGPWPTPPGPPARATPARATPARARAIRGRGCRRAAGAQPGRSAAGRASSTGCWPTSSTSRSSSASSLVLAVPVFVGLRLRDRAAASPTQADADRHRSPTRTPSAVHPARCCGIELGARRAAAARLLRLLRRVACSGSRPDRRQAAHEDPGRPARPGRHADPRRGWPSGALVQCVAGVVRPVLQLPGRALAAVGQAATSSACTTSSRKPSSLRSTT